MKRLLSAFWALVALVTLPGLVLAQTSTSPGGLSVRGYTDAKGAPLPTASDIRLAVSTKDGRTTATITGLQAYGEANVDGKDGAAQRLARYSDNSSFFEGGTVYALHHGNKYRGGRTASSAKLDEDKGVMVLAKGAVGKDQVTMTFPSLKAEQDFDCQTVSFLIVRKGGDKDVTLRHWLGHPGYATSNNAPGIGDYLFLAQDDARFPGTGFCYDKAGKLVTLGTKRANGLTLREELAKIVQRPEGVGAAPAKVSKGD